MYREYSVQCYAKGSQCIHIHNIQPSSAKGTLLQGSEHSVQKRVKLYKSNFQQFSAANFASFLSQLKALELLRLGIEQVFFYVL